MAALLRPAERKSRSFEQQLELLEARGVFSLQGAEDLLTDGQPLVDRLRDLKNRRRDAKHRWQGVDNDLANELSVATVVAVHLMLAAIRQEGEGAGPDPPKYFLGPPRPLRRIER
ncbi:MAG TPA: hypothetical protein VGI73_09080 [Solirubrobacterales bacterium]|jgi:hypothetical protein